LAISKELFVKAELTNIRDQVTEMHVTFFFSYQGDTISGLMLLLAAVTFLFPLRTRFDFISQLLASVLGVAKDNMGVILVENRILHASVTGVTDGSFKDEDVLALPHTQYRHSINATTRVILGRAGITVTGQWMLSEYSYEI
jgi:hypothetical protein